MRTVVESGGSWFPVKMCNLGLDKGGIISGIFERGETPITGGEHEKTAEMNMTEWWTKTGVGMPSSRQTPSFREGREAWPGLEYSAKKEKIRKRRGGRGEKI